MVRERNTHRSKNQRSVFAPPAWMHPPVTRRENVVILLIRVLHTHQAQNIPDTVMDNSDQLVVQSNWAVIPRNQEPRWTMIDTYQGSTRTNTTIINTKGIERIDMRDTTSVKNIGNVNTAETEHDMNPGCHPDYTRMTWSKDIIHHIVENNPHMLTILYMITIFL